MSQQIRMKSKDATRNTRTRVTGHNNGSRRGQATLDRTKTREDAHVADNDNQAERHPENEDEPGKNAARQDTQNHRHNETERARRGSATQPDSRRQYQRTRANASLPKSAMRRGTTINETNPHQAKRRNEEGGRPEGIGRRTIKRHHRPTANCKGGLTLS